MCENVNGDNHDYFSECGNDKGNNNRFRFSDNDHSGRGQRTECIQQSIDESTSWVLHCDWTDSTHGNHVRCCSPTWKNSPLLAFHLDVRSCIMKD